MAYQVPTKVAFIALDADRHIEAQCFVFSHARHVSIIDRKYGTSVGVSIEDLRAILAAAEKAFDAELPYPEHVAEEEARANQAPEPVVEEEHPQDAAERRFAEATAILEAAGCRDVAAGQGDPAKELLDDLASPCRVDFRSFVEKGVPRFLHNGKSVTGLVNRFKARGWVEFHWPTGGVSADLTDLGRAVACYLSNGESRL